MKNINSKTFKTLSLWLLAIIELDLVYWSLKEFTQCQLGIFSKVCTLALFDTIPIFLAVVFWGTGFFILWHKRPVIEVVFFLWGAGTLSTGLLSGGRDPITIVVFMVLLTLDAPIMAHFYWSMLKRPFKKLERISLSISYTFAGILLVVFLVSFFSLPFLAPPTKLMIRIIEGTFGLTAFWAWIILFQNYRRFVSLASRRFIRLSVMGAIYALLPLLALVILPRLFNMPTILPVLTFPWLLIIPMSYLYATFRSRIAFSEAKIINFLVYIMIATLFICAFLITRDLDELNADSPIRLTASLISIIIFIVSFIPLRKGLTAWVFWFFNGKDSEYKVDLQFLEKTLTTILERDTLTELLVNDLSAVIKPTNTILFLNQNDSYLAFAAAKKQPPERFSPIRLKPNGALALMLLSPQRPFDSIELKKWVSSDHFTDEEKWLLESPEIALWVPLISENQLQGLILLSLREGDDFYTQEDKNLLTSLVTIAGATIRNIILAEGIKAGKEELAQAHYQVITSQEEERKRIARELHDDTIQLLLGISYQVAEINKHTPLISGDSQALNNNLENVRSYLGDAISGLRALINELRPAGLDELGIESALENMVDKISATTPSAPEIHLEIHSDVVNLPDTHSICVYRIVQEAIRNAIKHAEASQISVLLEKQNQGISLSISDNGKGFLLPDRLSKLTTENHFGLVGILERAGSIGGKVEVLSNPGKGTRIIAHLPYTEMRSL